jgi:hypothetical protein
MFVFLADSKNIKVRRWEDNIKMDFQGVGCGRIDWTDLAQDRGR